MGTTARWRTSHKNLPQHLPSRGYLVHFNLVICIDQDECYHPTSGSQSSSRFASRHPCAHHHLHSQHHLPRLELRSHLAAALHAVPPRAAHQSQNNIKVTLRHFHLQQSPRQHHWGLIDHLRCYLDSSQALRGRILASCHPDDVYNSLTATW